MKCILCQSGVDDPLTLGEFIGAENIEVHYFCLLLAPGLFQKLDADTNALKGFEKGDIVKEARRVSALHCAYCKKKNANIGCCLKKCRHSFHLGCGVANGCQSEFDGTFSSFCDQHVTDRNGKARHSATQNCGICMEQMGAYSSTASVWASACCRNGWFHRLCLAEFAASAGYFFKCPLCNNVDDFKNEALLRGIYVPQKDASWELEENAFAELYVRPKLCDYDVCLCPHGRDYVDEADEADCWKLLICRGCGSKSTHKRCAGTLSEKFICGFCSGFVTEAGLPDSSSSEDESEDVDVEEVEMTPINPRNRKKRRIPDSSDDEDTPVRRVPKRRKSAARRRQITISDSSDSDDAEPLSSNAVPKVTMKIASVDTKSSYWNPKVVLTRLKNTSPQPEATKAKPVFSLSQWLKKAPVFQPEKLNAIAFAEVVHIRQVSAQKMEQLIEAGRVLKQQKLALAGDVDVGDLLGSMDKATDSMIISRIQYYDLENVRPGYVSPSKNPQSPVQLDTGRPKPPRFCLSPAKLNEMAQSPSIHSTTTTVARRFGTLLDTDERCAATVTSSSELVLDAVSTLSSNGEISPLVGDETWVSSSTEVYGTVPLAKSMKRPEGPNLESAKRQKVSDPGTGPRNPHLPSPSSAARPSNNQKLITNFLQTSSGSEELSSAAESSPRSPLHTVKRQIFRSLKTKSPKLLQGQKTMIDFFRRT